MEVVILIAALLGVAMWITAFTSAKRARIAAVKAAVEQAGLDYSSLSFTQKQAVENLLFSGTRPPKAPKPAPDAGSAPAAPGLAPDYAPD